MENISRYNPKIHHRRSVRLPEYNYGQNGAYFVTICTHNKQMLFDDRRIKRIVENEWSASAERRDNVIIDEFVVMPNHLHGIIVINNPHPPSVSDTILHVNGAPSHPRAYINTPLQGDNNGKRKFKSPSQTLGAIIRGFKAASTTKINILRSTPRIPVWQRNYHEHIIRNDNDLHDIRKYIIDNPIKWEIDEYNPEYNNHS